MAMLPLLHKSQFSLDDRDETFEGYTAGHTWNGWACPYFTAAVAQQLVDLWTKAESATLHASYDAISDTYSFLDEDGMDEPDTYRVEPHEVEGQIAILYPIGNGCWCWDEIKAEK